MRNRSKYIRTLTWSDDSDSFGEAVSRKTIVLDDLDPKQEAAETITFAFGATIYEIDLGHPNLEKLSTFLAPFIAVGRVVDPKAGARRFTSLTATPSIPGMPPTPPITGAEEPDPSVVRAWAIDNGYSVEPKGRVPVNITDAYKAAKAREAAE
jgi:Lsr2